MIEVYASVITTKKGSGYGAIVRVRQGAKWEELIKFNDFVDSINTDIAIFSCMFQVLDWLLAYGLNREEIVYYSDNSLKSIDKNVLSKQISLTVPKFKRIKFEQISRAENVMARTSAGYQISN